MVEQQQSPPSMSASRPPGLLSTQLFSIADDENFLGAQSSRKQSTAYQVDEEEDEGEDIIQSINSLLNKGK